jgi:alanine racemase
MRDILRCIRPVGSLAVAPVGPNATADTSTDLATHPTWIEVSRSGIAHNVALCREAAGVDRLFIASVKAGAYGHGVVEVAQVLEECGVHHLWTGSFQDALSLRAAGIGSRIFMFAGALPEGMADLVRIGVTPTIVNHESAEAVAAASTAPVKVAVKVDCGFGRLGPRVDRGALELLQAVASNPCLILDCVYTHLPFGDQTGLEWAMAGTGAFAQLLDQLAAAGIRRPEIVQAGASGEVLTRTVKPVDTAVCVGHALYGLNPFTTLGLGGPTPLQASATLRTPTRAVMAAVRSRLIHISRHESVSVEYAATGLQFIGPAAAGTTEAPRTLGIIPYGLGDGARIAIPPHVAEVLIHGIRCPIVATSLEYTTIDLTTCVDVAGIYCRVGDEVTLMGHSCDRVTSGSSDSKSTLAPVPRGTASVKPAADTGLTSADTTDRGSWIGVEEWAAWYGVSPLEMLCSIGGRMRTVVVS